MIGLDDSGEVTLAQDLGHIVVADGGEVPFPARLDGRRAPVAAAGCRHVLHWSRHPGRFPFLITRQSFFRALFFPSPPRLLTPLITRDT